MRCDLTLSYNIYTGLLKAFPLPDAKINKIQFSHDCNHTKFNALKSRYPIEGAAGNGGDFSKAENIMHWISGNVYHKGDYSGSIADNSLDLLDYAFGKGSGYGINCAALATILSECLMAVGINAKKVFIKPCSPYDGDNHVVVHVFINEIKKWVMFDPTLNAYVMNEQGKYLSLLDLRSHLANQKPVFFNNKAKYNDEVWTSDTTKVNIDYFAKNLFYFQTSEISTFNNKDTPNNRFITLCPNGYNPKQVLLNNIEYRIKKYGDGAYLQEWLEIAKQDVYVYCSTVDFERLPDSD